MAAVAVPQEQQPVHRQEQWPEGPVLADVVQLVASSFPCIGLAATMTVPSLGAE